MNIAFDNTYARLPERFYARVRPEKVPRPQQVRVNEELAEQLGISPEWLHSEAGLGFLSGNEIVAGSEPLAQAYAGHQFGHFVPQLGDGRAILLGEVVDAQGARRDIQLKGSGRTPFSRGGDGKAALGPALREYLVSEAMHALGVPTSRALAVVTTGEAVLRDDGPLAGAVFTRVAASHLRVGTFQYFAARQDIDALRTLTGYALERHYPHLVSAQNQALALLGAVAGTQAALIAQWLGLGFIHGVMNTDNFSISGETIDYGPCAFMDVFHPDCVFSAIDRHGRYAWANQPSIGQWNLARLAETLLPLISENEVQAEQMAQEILQSFSEQFREAYERGFAEKLGLPNPDADAFLQRTFRLLAENEIDFTLFFTRLTEFAKCGDAAPLRALASAPASIDEWIFAWRELVGNAPAIAQMERRNPVLIPRNHRIEQAIRAAYDGDFSLFHRLAEAWRQPYEAKSEFADLQTAPAPDEVVRRTFCGT